WTRWRAASSPLTRRRASSSMAGVTTSYPPGSGPASTTRRSIGRASSRWTIHPGQGVGPNFPITAGGTSTRPDDAPESSARPVCWRPITGLEAETTGTRGPSPPPPAFRLATPPPSRRRRRYPTRGY
ncbi:MAG: hypothetical protein AVDCRST_MAG19-87, partial [uncultured Thermomicrobiales bacterium]